MAGPGAADSMQELVSGLVESRPFDECVALDDSDPLGSGRFGRVMSGTWRATGEPVAVKIPVSADFSRAGETPTCAEPQAEEGIAARETVMSLEPASWKPTAAANHL